MVLPVREKLHKKTYDSIQVARFRIRIRQRWRTELDCGVFWYRGGAHFGRNPLLSGALAR